MPNESKNGKDDKTTLDSFEINEFITLKLEGGKTQIYINGNLFRQCVTLFLEIPVSDNKSYFDLHSIDDFVEERRKYGMRMIENYTPLSPEEEFWGHCSNLQAWVENDYDTRLLRSNLAFPLLKKLTEVGDKKAKRVYKEEIAKRFIHGNFTTRLYLIEENYLKELTQEQFLTILQSLDFKNFLNERGFDDIFWEFLNLIVDLGDEKVKRWCKNQVIKIFVEGNLKNQLDIINFFPFDLFSKADLQELLKKIDYKSFLEDLFKNDIQIFRFNLPSFLHKMNEVGNQEVNEFYKEKVKEFFIKSNVNIQIKIIDRKLLHSFNIEEIENVVRKEDLDEHMEEFYASDMISKQKEIYNLFWTLYILGIERLKDFLKEILLYSFYVDGLDSTSLFKWAIRTGKHPKFSNEELMAPLKDLYLNPMNYVKKDQLFSHSYLSSAILSFINLSQDSENLVSLFSEFLEKKQIYLMDIDKWFFTIFILLAEERYSKKKEKLQSIVIERMQNEFINSRLYISSLFLERFYKYDFKSAFFFILNILSKFRHNFLKFKKQILVKVPSNPKCFDSLFSIYISKIDLILSKKSECFWKAGEFIQKNKEKIDIQTFLSNLSRFFKGYSNEQKTITYGEHPINQFFFSLKNFFILHFITERKNF
jgi:hypothetical protein